MREEREGSKQQPEALGSRRGRWNETHTECQLGEKKRLRRPKAKDVLSWVGIFLGKKIVCLEADLGEMI